MEFLILPVGRNVWERVGDPGLALRCGLEIRGPNEASASRGWMRSPGQCGGWREKRVKGETSKKDPGEEKPSEDPGRKWRGGEGPGKRNALEVKGERRAAKSCGQRRAFR